MRDVVVALAVVGTLLGSVWAFTGQPFPEQAPLVVIESGSMMHGPYRAGNRLMPTGWDDPPFGRTGTIDPGDLVFVKAVHSLDDIETAFAAGPRSGYGGHGDVIVYRPNGAESTPIIHRAMLRVDAEPPGCSPGDCVLRVPEACDPGFLDFVGGSQDPATVQSYCDGTVEGISLHLRRDGLELKLVNYGASGNCDPFYSSIITKGDNNPSSDQASENGGCRALSQPVRLEWIIGKSRGEIPWFGMIKLSLWGNPRYSPDSDPTLGSNFRLFAAVAPSDIWGMLFVSIGIIVVAPVVTDLIVTKWRARRPGNPGQPRREKAESD